MNDLGLEKYFSFRCRATLEWKRMSKVSYNLEGQHLLLLARLLLSRLLGVLDSDFQTASTLRNASL